MVRRGRDKLGVYISYVVWIGLFRRTEANDIYIGKTHQLSGRYSSHIRCSPLSLLTALIKESAQIAVFTSFGVRLPPGGP